MPRKTPALLLFCALVIAAVFAVPARADAATADSSACGEPVARDSGGEWTCTFADEFEGTALNRQNWQVMQTATSGFTHAFECYVDHPGTVSVANGNLRLTSNKLPKWQWCGWLFPTPFFSGMVITKNSFSQAYGRFEARIKFPTGKGFVASWWLWPRHMAYGKQSGEIDIAEHYGAYPQIVSPYVHIKGPQGEERGRGAYCNMATAEGEFHTYTLEWEPLGGMVFLYDGVPCMKFDNWNPGAPLTYPQPFDQPFFLNLTLAHGWGNNSVGSTTPFPATMAVDYVRVWS